MSRNPCWFFLLLLLMSVASQASMAAEEWPAAGLDNFGRVGLARLPSARLPSPYEFAFSYNILDSDIITRGVTVGLGEVASIGVRDTLFKNPAVPVATLPGMDVKLRLWQEDDTRPQAAFIWEGIGADRFYGEDEPERMMLAFSKRYYHADVTIGSVVSGDKRGGFAGASYDGRLGRRHWSIKADWQNDSRFGMGVNLFDAKRSNDVGLYLLRNRVGVRVSFRNRFGEGASEIEREAKKAQKPVLPVITEDKEVASMRLSAGQADMAERVQQAFASMAGKTTPEVETLRVRLYRPGLPETVIVAPRASVARLDGQWAAPAEYHQLYAVEKPKQAGFAARYRLDNVLELAGFDPEIPYARRGSIHLSADMGGRNWRFGVTGALQNVSKERVVLAGIRGAPGLRQVRSDSDLEDNRRILSRFTVGHDSAVGSLRVGLLEPTLGGVAWEGVIWPDDSRVALLADIAQVWRKQPGDVMRFQDKPLQQALVGVQWFRPNGVSVRLDGGQFLAGDLGGSLQVEKQFRHGAKLEFGVNISEGGRFRLPEQDGIYPTFRMTWPIKPGRFVPDVLEVESLTVSNQILIAPPLRDAAQRLTPSVSRIEEEASLRLDTILD